MKWKAMALAALMLAPAGALAQAPSYSGLRPLSAVTTPSLRAALEEARAAAARADEAASKARAAASTAEGMAEHARRGEKGTSTANKDWMGNTYAYAGELSDTYPNGYATRLSTGGPGKGDSYAGQWQNGLFVGSGIYKYGANSNNSVGLKSFQGDWAHDKIDGYGVYDWDNGDRYRGHMTDNRMEGFGIYEFFDGRVYEGAWRNDYYHGFGIVWAADGRTMIEAGVYAAGKLVTPMTP